MDWNIMVNASIALANAGVAYFTYRAYKSVNRISEANIAILNRGVCSVYAYISSTGIVSLFVNLKSADLFQITQISIDECTRPFEYDVFHREHGEIKLPGYFCAEDRSRIIVRGLLDGTEASYRCIAYKSE